MASPSPDLDIEAQTNSGPEAQLAIIPDPLPTANTRNDANPQLPTTPDPHSQGSEINQGHKENGPAQQTTEVQRDENHGDSSDGLWSMYLTEAEKQDKEVTESWKGDTDGILVFTGLFSATVAAFIIESYRDLSPDSSDTTNALLAQISQQLVDISNGTPLKSVSAQSGQPFEPTASAVRVNVLWFLSLILSLTCALSATLIQQWARRYQELAQRRGAFHRRARMRAYIFDGINRFGMARVVATMPTLMHISVFFFFAGLVDFLFPIYATVAYATLGCIGMFALAYAILTILPNIYLNCPYGTPLSGFTWRIFQFSEFGFLWTILKIEGLFRKSWSKSWSLANQHVTESHRLKTWRKTLEKQVKIHRQWFLQSLRTSVELSAYGAESTVVTSALEWTLAALDEDKEIEDFAARVPGFFDSRVVPDATSAVLSLMSHQPNTDPILGSRLYDLLETCIPGMSLLDEKLRKHRLRVCLNCLWCFGRAYSQPGASRPLPYYFPNSLIPEITRRIQTEGDLAIRVTGRCVLAVIINKLATDLKSRTITVNGGVLTCLSAILGTEGYDLKFLLHQPDAVALANVISLAFGEVGTFAADAVPPDVLDMVQQTLGILSQSQENTELQLEQTTAIFDNSDKEFERILVSRLLDLLDTCTQVTSPLSEDIRTSCLFMCLKGLWYFGRAFNQLRDSVPLPSNICTAFTPEMVRAIRQQRDHAVRVVGRCVGALVVNKLVANLNSRPDSLQYMELECLTSILGIEGHGVLLLLRQPGAVALANIVSLVFDEAGIWIADTVPSNVLRVVQHTLTILSKALPAQENADSKWQLEQKIAIFNSSYRKFEHILISHLLDLLNTCIQETSPLTEEVRTSCLRMCLKGLWYFGRAFNQLGNSVPLPSNVLTAFTPEMVRAIRHQRDLATRMVGRCLEALVVNKLASNLNLHIDPTRDAELECLSAILATEGRDVELLPRQPGAVALEDFISLVFDEAGTWDTDTIPSDVLDVVQQTLPILSRALSAQESAELQLEETIAIFNGSDGKFEYILVSRLLDLLNKCIQETPLLTEEVRTSCLRMCLRSLWHLTRKYCESENSVPLPSYVYFAFTNPEMTRCIHQNADLATRMIGRCVEALVVSKLAADNDSRNIPLSNDRLACLSTILGVTSHNVRLCLSHPGAIQFTNMVILALDDFYFSAFESVPSYVVDVVQQTSTALAQALPLELNVETRLNQTDTLINVFDGTSSESLTAAEMYRNVLRVWMMNLWHFTRECNERGNSVPLPSFVYIAFTNPTMIRRIRRGADLATRMIGRCVEALVVSKLAADINSRDVPVSDDELACLSAILSAKDHDVRNCLSHPGTIELVNLASLAFGDVSSLRADQVPPSTRSVLQQTLSTLSRALPAQANAELPLDQEVALVNSSVDKFERIIVSRLLGLLRMCIPGASSLMEEVRASCLGMCLKSLWHCGKVYHQTSDPLPSYFPLVFARPGITRQIRTEEDPVAHITGCCFGALIVSKLVDALESPSTVSVGVRNAELACISAILGSEHHKVSILPHQHRLINFRNVVSLMSGEIDSLFTAAGTPADVLDTAQDTLYMLADRLFVPGGLPMDQGLLLHERYSDIANALRSDHVKNETVKTLSRLRQILGKPLPGVEFSEDTAIQDLGH